jgi:hypothetical protein
LYLEFRLVRFRDNKIEFKDKLIIKNGRWGNFIWKGSIWSKELGIVEIKREDIGLEERIKEIKIIVKWIKYFLAA